MLSCYDVTCFELKMILEFGLFLVKCHKMLLVNILTLMKYDIKTGRHMCYTSSMNVIPDMNVLSRVCASWVRMVAVMQA